MNIPPGYYRDEKGLEYYWDGQQRSYIPENPYRQFKADVDRAAPWILGGLLLPSLLPVAAAVIFLVVVAVFAVLQSPVALLSVFAFVGIIFFVIVHDRRVAEEERNRGAEQERARAQPRAEAKIQVDERQKEDEERMERFRRIGEEIDQNLERRMSEKNRQADN